MIWSTARGLRRTTPSVDVADEVVALLLHGCLVDPPRSRAGPGGTRSARRAQGWA
jgi:hypothetical protein